MKIEGLENMKGVKLPKISQIGIVVPDIGKAICYYSKFLNIKPWFRSKIRSNDAAFKGESFPLALDIALAFSGGLEIELIQMLTDRECIYSDIMKKQGGGLHHIGAMVRGFDKKLEQMKAAGIGVIQSGVIKTVGGAVTKYAYMDTVSTCGIISEIIESKLAGIPVFHNNFMMHVARLTGDIDLIPIQEAVDTALIRKELGWKTKVPYVEAMERISEWVSAAFTDSELKARETPSDPK